MPDGDNDRHVALLPGVVHLAFFVRYAMLVPAALLLLALLGWQFRTNTILGNMFLVDGRHQMFHLTWLALVAVALSMVQARVTLLNAKDRFRDCPNWDFDGPSFTLAWSRAVDRDLAGHRPGRAVGLRVGDAVRQQGSRTDAGTYS